MNETVICKSSPVKVLAVSAAPFQELLNFLIYREHTDLLTERARKPPPLSWEKHSLTIKESIIVLGAESLNKNGKLFFNARRLKNTSLSCSTITERSFGFIISDAASVGQLVIFQSSCQCRRLFNESNARA